MPVPKKRPIGHKRTNAQLYSRINAARTAGSFANLKPLISHESTPIRLAAVETLSGMRAADRGVYNFLQQRLSKEPNAQVREEIVRQMNRISEILR